MLTVKNLNVSYERHAVLRDVSFSVPDGSTTAILGPNGSGKTTLLRAILGLIPASKESVFLDKRPIESFSRRELARHIAYVPQQHAGVFPFLVEEVVLMGRTARSPWIGFSAKDEQAAADALCAVGVEHLAKRPYSELSGGERQLVLIARALAQGCATLVMDEPESALDYGNQFLILDKIVELQKSGLTTIFTTHHPDHALYAGGSALLIKNGQVFGAGPASTLLTQETIAALYTLGERASAWICKARGTGNA